MKYFRLTKEQLLELEQEFINFLATQSITGEEWTEIKKDRPEIAEEQIDIFSDLIWEGVLNQAGYLENISHQHMFLFMLGNSEMKVIAVKVLDSTKDLTTADGYKWLQKNYGSDAVEFQTAVKSYSDDKNSDIFKLIKEGAIITKGELFDFFDRLLGS